MAQKIKTSSLPYMPTLDGLRGLAILAVLFYHAGLSWMPGGFLGVEIFFVLSGYLIASSLLAEWRERGKIDFASFWKRRAYRLFPALVLLVLVTLAYAAIWLSVKTASIRSDALASLGYMSNWHFIITKRPYFEAIGRPPLFRHTWALAVEGQFYFLWVPVFILTMKRGSRKRLLGVAVLGAIAATLLMAFLFQPDNDLSRIYYGTDTRLGGILIGTALACVWPPKKSQVVEGKENAWGMDVLGLGMVIALVGACWRINEFHIFLYQGGFALVALATVIVIGVSIHPRTRLTSKLLGNAPLRWLGERSYGIYLWHWPIFMVTRPRLDLSLDGVWLLILRFAITGILVELSYQFLERPIRYGTKPWARRLRPSILRGMSIFALLAFVILAGKILPVEAPLRELSSLFSYEEKPTIEISKTMAAQAEGQLKATATNQPPTPTEEILPSPTVIATSLPLATVVPSLSQTPESSTPIPTPTITSTPSPTPITHVTAFGDSVMAGSAQIILKTIENIEIEAAKGRQVYETIWLLGQYDKKGQLGDVVVFHIGSNGIFRGSHFDEIMAIVGDELKIIFVNVRVPRRWQDPINEMLISHVAKYPNVVLADWYARSENHPEYFINDGVHLTEEGMSVYAELIALSIAQTLENQK